MVPKVSRRGLVAGTKYSIAQRFTFSRAALTFRLCVPASTKDDVERACPAMPGMGVAHGRDMGGVSRGREPVTHGRAYRTSLDRPALVGRRIAGDEQHHPRAHRHGLRSEEHTSELQSLMRNSSDVFCLNTKNTIY